MRCRTLGQILPKIAHLVASIHRAIHRPGASKFSKTTDMIIFSQQNEPHSKNFFVGICRCQWFEIVHTTPNVWEGAKGFLVKPIQKIFTTLPNLT